MSDVCPRERLADPTRARLVEWAEIIAISSMFEHAFARCSENRSIACDASGQYAVKHIDPAFHALKEIIRAADSHQVARLVRWQQRSGISEYLVHQWLRLADAKPSDRIARKVELDKALRRFSTHIEMLTTLHDAEQGLFLWSAMRFFATLCPCQGAI